MCGQNINEAVKRSLLEERKKLRKVCYVIYEKSLSEREPDWGKVVEDLDVCQILDLERILSRTNHE